MTACLSRFGSDVHLARDGAEALQRAESRTELAFVFVDAALIGERIVSDMVVAETACAPLLS